VCGAQRPRTLGCSATLTRAKSTKTTRELPLARREHPAAAGGAPGLRGYEGLRVPPGRASPPDASLATSRAPARPEVRTCVAFTEGVDPGCRSATPGRKRPSGRECPGRRRSGSLLGRASGSLATLARADPRVPAGARCDTKEIAASPAGTIKIEGAAPPVVQGRAAPARRYRPSPPDGHQRWIARSTSDGRRGPQRCTGALRIGNPAARPRSLPHARAHARSARARRERGPIAIVVHPAPARCEAR
jgi:hypothetical protein